MDHLHTLLLARRRQLRRHLAAQKPASDHNNTLGLAGPRQPLHPVKVLDLAQVRDVVFQGGRHSRQHCLAAPCRQQHLAEADDAPV